MKTPISAKSYILKSTRKNGSIRIQIFNEDPSMTLDQSPEKHDINSIIKNYSQSGHWPTSSKVAIYDEEGQIPHHTDLLEATQLIQDASYKFNSLPSTIREKFKNDPTQMIHFLNDPKNYKEAQNIGLIPKRDDSNDAIPPKDSPPEPPKP